MKIESPLFIKEDGRIRCIACERRCLIPQNSSGFCGVRSNKGGRAELIVYGRPAAKWIDPIEKKPLFHFLPGEKAYSIGTFGCNFGCIYCQNWDLSQAPAEERKRGYSGWIERFERLNKSVEFHSPERIVREAKLAGCKAIAFTYNEPTIFSEYAVDIMKIARKEGIRGVFITNGYETPECWRYLSKWIDAANIDLKAFSQEFYGKLCGAMVEPVKNSIKTVKKRFPHVWIEITTLIIPGYNSGKDEIGGIAEFIASVDKNIPWHITAFHPDYMLLDAEPTSRETLFSAYEIGKEAGLRYVYVGNIPNNPFENTLCPKCKTVVVERTGFESIPRLKDGRCPKCKYKVEGVWK